MRRLRVGIICIGLGRDNRGYEVFASQLYENLHRYPSIELNIVSAFKLRDYPRSLHAPMLDRDGLVAKVVSQLFGVGARYTEQTSFGLAVALLYGVGRFDVVISSERYVLNVLSRFSSLRRSFPRTVFCNGSAQPPPYGHIDLVIHHARETYNSAMALDTSGSRHHFLPCPVENFSSAKIYSDDQVSRIRQNLGLPLDRKIVVSVGVVDQSRKRMDAVIRSVHKLDLADRPFLLLLGPSSTETGDTLSLADELLGHRNYAKREVPVEQMHGVLSACDCFVLASTREGYGRVYVEALLARMPCIVHDGGHQRQLLKEYGFYVDMRSTDALAAIIGRIIQSPPSAETLETQRRYAELELTWAALAKKYLEVLESALDS